MTHHWDEKEYCSRCNGYYTDTHDCTALLYEYLEKAVRVLGVETVRKWVGSVEQKLIEEKKTWDIQTKNQERQRLLEKVREGQEASLKLSEMQEND